MGVTDLGLDFRAAQIGRYAEAGFGEDLFEFDRIFVGFFAQWANADLLWSEPHGEGASEVLDKHSDEAFHRAEGGSVDHDRSVGLVVSTGVFEFEAFGEVVVELDGTELPMSADAIADHEVGFGPVEGRFALGGGEVQAGFYEDLSKGRFGFLPVLFATDVFVAFGISER